MRTLNLRFAAGMVLFLTLAGVSVFFLHRYQYSRIAADLLWQADRAHEAGEFDDAVRFSYQYLEFCPDDTQRLVTLADWLEARGAKGRKQVGQVVALLDRALQVAPDRDDLRRRAIALNQRIGRWGECLDHLDRLLPQQPEDAELLAAMGVCQEALGKHIEAAEAFENAWKANPKRVATALDYAALLVRHLERPADARQLLEKAVQNNPQSAEAQLGLAKFLRASGKLKEAEAAALEAVRLAPNDVNNILALADVYQAGAQFKLARETMEKAATLAPHNGRVVCQFAWLLLYSGQSAAAIAKLQANVKANPNDVETLTLLGDILAIDGRIDALEQVVGDLQRLRQVAPERGWNADYLAARLMMRRGDWAKAAQQLEHLRGHAARLPAVARQANLLLAQCYEQLHDRPQELNAYRRILDADRNAGHARLEYARALTRDGQFVEAGKQLRWAVQQADLPPRSIGDAVFDLIDRITRADAVAVLRDVDRVWDTVRVDDVSNSAVLAKVEWLRCRQRQNEALRFADQFLNRRPNNVAMIAAKARVLDSTAGPQRALAFLNDAERRVGERADFRSTRIRLAAPRLTPTSKDDIAALNRPNEQFTNDERTRILGDLISACGQAGADAAFREALEELRSLRADDLQSRSLLLSRALLANDEPQIATLLAELEQIEGANGLTRRIFEVERQIRQPNPSAAVPLLDELVKSHPRHPLVAFLRGRLAETQERAAEAKDHYTAALDLGLLSQPVEQHFFNLMSEDASTRRCRVLIEDSPLFDRLRLETDGAVIRAALALATASVRPSLADRLYGRHAHATAPQMVWLGRQFEQFGLSRFAEAALTRAAQLAPLSDEAWSARIAFHAGRQDMHRVQELVVEAKKALPAGEPVILLVRNLEQAGLPSDALKDLRAAARATGNSAGTNPRQSIAALLQVGNMPAARQKLEALIADSATSADDRRWARHTLAINLTIAPSRDACMRSEQLLADNLRETGDNPDYQRALATVYSAQRSQPVDKDGATGRQVAIRILQQLSPSCVDDLIMLAHLYRSEGDFVKHQETLTRLEQTFGDHPAALQLLVRERLFAGQHEAAGPLVRRLTKVDGERFDTVALRFTHAVTGQDIRGGVELFESHIAAAPLGPTRAARQLRCGHAVVDVLNSYPFAAPGTSANNHETVHALRSNAIRWYRAGLGRDPQALLQLVTLYCKQGQVDQAFDLLLAPQTTKEFSIEAQAAAFVLALRHGQASEQQVKSIERQIAEWVRQRPNSLALLLTEADLHEWRQRPAEAARLYRQVLELDPGNAMALNNLAWTEAADPAKIPSALRLVEEAIKRNGPLDELLDTRGRLLVRANRPAEGVRDLVDASANAPAAARYFHLAVACRQAGQTERAEWALARARQFGLSPTDLLPADAETYRQMVSKNQ